MLRNYLITTCFSLILLFAFLASPLTVSAQTQGQKTLMAIFAHPDDEMTVAPILSRYVREGIKVYLVVCTDGRYGTNDFSGLKGGDGLAALRRDEMKCAAEKIGVELIHLTYHDQLKASEGYDGHMPHARALITDLYHIVSEKQPDVLITWGPDGGTSHMDHRLVGASVTQVFVSQNWSKPSSLFFVGTPSNLVDDPNEKILRGVDPKYLNTKVTYTEEDLKKAAESVACHKRQMQPKDVESITERRRKNGLVVYLREFTGPGNSRTSVF